MSQVVTLFRAKLLLVLLVCAAAIDTNAQALAGAYTIGGASPDYATIGAAISHLETNGVSSPVTFNIRPGTYNEHLSLGDVAGTSDSNRVTFQSEALDSSTVLITHTATSMSDAWTFRIDSADYIELKHLSLSNPATTATAVVWFENGADNNTVSNCHLTGPNAVYWSNYCANVYSSDNSADNNLTITNNYLDGNDRGIHLRGIVFSNHEDGHYIANNTFVNQQIGASELYACDHVQFNDNYIDQNSFGAGAGFTFINGDLDVIGNKIIIDSIAATGLNFNGAQVDDALVANNYIYVKPVNGGSGGRGIAFSSTGSPSGAFNLYHNTIDVAGNDDFNDCCVFSQFSSENGSIHFQNNVLHITNGVVYNIADPGSFGTMDYNGLWSTGEVLAVWGNNAPGNIAELQSASGKEANSVEAEPTFAGPGDFHLLAAGGYDGGGTSLIGFVAIDCDGEARSASNPDMGCDEFTAAATELAVLSVDSLGGECSDTVFVYATVQNLGSVTYNNPVLSWSLDGVEQGTVVVGDSVPPGQRRSFNLASMTQAAGVSYTVAVYVDTLGGAIMSNDTATVTFAKAISGGTYTIGGTSPDYPTIAAAADAISAGGVCGPVVFNVRTGIYNEQACIRTVIGASATNTITFQSESGDSSDVQVSWNATGADDNYVFKIEGTDYVTLQKLTILPTGTNYGQGVVLTNRSSQFTLANCELVGDSSTSQNDNKDLFNANGAFHDQVVITNNLFKFGDRAVSIVDAFNNPQIATGVQVINNTCLHNGYGGIEVESLRSPLVANNYVTVNDPIPGYTGISAYQCMDSTRLVSNEVYALQANAQYGINIWASEGTASERIVVANNAVSMALGVYGTFGIEIGPNNQYTDVFNNSSYIRDVGQWSPSSYPLEVWGFNTRLYNNNCHNENGYGFGLFFNTVLDSADNNNYYSATTDSIYANFAKQSLADYQALVAGEANTQQVKPKFSSWNNLRTNAQALDNAGHPLPALATDITGAARNLATPDIGAYEFTHVPFSCPEPTNLRARLVQDVSARLLWNTVGDATGYKVYLKVAGNATWDTVFFKASNNGVLNLTGLTPNTIYKWTVSARCGAQCEWSDPVLPHGRFRTLGQPCAAPDSVSTSPIKVDKARLNWVPSANAKNNIVRWREQGTSVWNYELKDGFKAVHWLTGLTAATTYEWQVRTRCSKGNESSTPWSGLQTFTTATSKTDDLLNATTQEATILLYPNPVRNQLQLYAVQPGADGTVLVQLFDAQGRLVMQESRTMFNGELTTTFDVSNLEKGIYMVRIAGAARWSQHLIVD